MNKILVTGGAGFIGSHLVDELVKNKNKVYVIDNLSTGKIKNLNKKAEFIKLDINQKSVYRQILKINPDYIIHLAAQTSINKSQLNPREDFETNLLALLPILDASVKVKVKKFIFSSSAAVYGVAQKLPVLEDSPKNPSSPYAISKLSAEFLVCQYNSRYNLPYTIFRYSNVYGPRQSATQEGGVVSIFINNLIYKRPVKIFGDGNQTRDFVYVADVINANMLALKNNITGIYNVSTARQISINTLYKKITAKLNINFGAKKVQRNFLEVQKSALSWERIKSELDWEPVFSIDQGLDRTISYFKNIK